VLIVDKINALRQHRREILDAIEHGVSGDAVFIQLAHPDDAPGRLDCMVRLCIERIQGRGEGHRTLLASNPKVPSILRMTAGGAEAMQPDELRRFSACVAVDATQPPAQAAMQVLADLDRHHLLGRFCLHDLVTQDRLGEALAVTRVAEERLAGGAGAGLPAQVRRRPAAPVWYWTVDFDAEATAAARALWRACSPDAPGLEPAADVHVTLLFLGGRGSDEEVAARYPHLRAEGPGGVRRLCEAMRASEGQEVEVEVAGVVWDGRVAAAEVVGLHGLCANLHPHITLAHGPGVPPRVSNELLARRAANADFPAGLGSWLAELGAADAEPGVRAWCQGSGAATADEVARSAAEVVAAMGAQSAALGEDRLASLRQTLAHAAPGAVGEAGVAPFRSPLRLHGRVRGRLRGE